MLDCVRYPLQIMNDSLENLRSALPGMVWPAWPTPASATMLALQFQLEQTQWWSPARLREHQLRQLRLLLRHAQETVPFYRERLADAGVRAERKFDEHRFAELPRLTRAEVHASGDALHSRALPPSHAPVAQGQTSGSTGTPVTFLSTRVTQLFWQAFNLRDHLWHGRDLGLKLATIRPDRGNRDEHGRTAPHWTPLLAELFGEGPSGLLHSSNPISRQIDWLVEQNPDYVLTLATNLLELAREMSRRGLRLPRLREARSFGEALGPTARAECAALLGVKVVDMYTSQEAGYLALQCPESGHYHAQSEGVIVEVLDDRGHPCREGGIGRVVVTPLHNYAMPLIRYEIGDYAEAGGSCACGRGLPVIRRVLGRERNLAIAPDGGKFYPSFAAEVWAGIGGIRQIQLVQKTPRTIAIRYAAARELSGEEAGRLSEALRAALGHPFEFSLVRMDSVPRAASGKYEDFICEVRA